MMIKPRLIFERLRSSMWIVPLGIVVVMIGAGQGLLLLDDAIELDLGVMAGAGIDGARGMLQAVATSMVTVAGVVFSLTLLALSQASAQYSPRVLRNFMRDRNTQVVLGVFLGVYAYCLVLLRGMGNETGAGMPSLSILGGLVAALVSVVYLIYFFHHIAESLQLENILCEIEAETLPVVKRIYQADAKGVVEAGTEPIEAPSSAYEIPAPTAGYVQDIELTGLSEIAERLDVIIHIPLCVGEFVMRGKPLALVPATQPLADGAADEIAATFSLGQTRSIQQDPAYGIRQMVDVALKALSPGINDTTNAIMVIDRIGVIMMELAARPFPSRRRLLHDRTRLIVAHPSFEGLLGLSFDQIRQWGSENPAVLGRLLAVLGDLLGACSSADRQALVRNYGRRVLAAAERSVSDPGDLDWVRDCYRKNIDVA